MEDLKMMVFVQLWQQKLVAGEKWGGLQARQTVVWLHLREGGLEEHQSKVITTAVEIQSLLRVIIPDFSRPAPP